jgi:hypothetical protein
VTRYNLSVRAGPDDELLALIAETNDLRRRFGQALVALHRALIAARGRGQGLSAAVRAWAPGAAGVMEGGESRAGRLRPHERDERLRKFAGEVLGRLAADLARGESMLAAFLRDLEASFPALTAMMKEEGRGSKIHDLEFAREMKVTLGVVARGDRVSSAASLSALAAALVQGAVSAR